MIAFHELEDIDLYLIFLIEILVLHCDYFLEGELFFGLDDEGLVDGDVVVGFELFLLLFYFLEYLAAYLFHVGPFLRTDFAYFSFALF